MEETDEVIDLSECLSQEQVSRLFPVTVGQLKDWRARNIGPAYYRLTETPKGRICYARADLDEYFAAARVEPSN